MTDLFAAPEMGAEFSPCRRWRYRLWRIWGNSCPPKMMMFLGMNPSIATETTNDPTVAKMIRYAQARGYDGLFVGNVFAWVETDSRKLPSLVEQGVDIIGPGNDAAIMAMARMSSCIVCGCGNPSMLLDRWASVRQMMQGLPAKVFKLNANGTPVHPLYQRNDAELIDL